MILEPLEPKIWPAHLPRPSIDHIQQVVSSAMRMQDDRIFTKGRRGAGAPIAKRMFAEVCKRVRGMSTPEIAISLGGGAHSTFSLNGDWICEFVHSSAGTAAYNEIIRILVHDVENGGGKS